MFFHFDKKQTPFKKSSVFFNILITFFILVAATGLSFLFFYIASYNNAFDNNADIYLIYILALILISKYTDGYAYGIVSSLIAVICVNYIFTYPYFALNFTLAGYPLSFVVMLTITLSVCTMTSHLRAQSTIIKEKEKDLREAELEKMRANLLRAISHDLRTPLTSMLGNSTNCLDNHLYLTEREKLDLMRSIHQDATWLLNMVENLLTVTRIQGDNLQISTSLESVEEVVSEALFRLNKRFPNSEIRASVPEEMLLVPMDAVLIEQVIINLIENAIVHSKSEKPIDLIVTKEMPHVVFTIRDYGKGISPEKLDTLFDGGAYCAKESTDTHKGIGIGLSICKTIITAHRGEISGKNHPYGAEFCFRLPLEAANLKGTNHESQSKS